MQSTFLEGKFAAQAGGVDAWRLFTSPVANRMGLALSS